MRQSHIASSDFLLSMQLPELFLCPQRPSILGQRNSFLVRKVRQHDPLELLNGRLESYGIIGCRVFIHTIALRLQQVERFNQLFMRGCPVADVDLLGKEREDECFCNNKRSISGSREIEMEDKLNAVKDGSDLNLQARGDV